MRKRILILVTLSLALAAPAVAAAAEADRSADAARAGGEEGLRLYAAGRWSEAYDVFRRADGFFHAPTLVLYMAHCEKQLGKLVLARDLYRRVAGEQVAADAPEQFLSAQAVAREELARLTPRIPTLQLSALRVTEAPVRVLVDGIEVPAQEGRRDLDPGDHLVEAVIQGEAPITRTITLAEGGQAEVLIPLPRRAAAASPATGAGKAGAILGSSFTPPAVAFGVAAASLVIGAGTGIASLRQVADLRSRCTTDGHCPIEDAPAAISTARLADASTALFVVAGVAAGAGAALLVLRPGGPLDRKAWGTLHVTIGPGAAGLGGTF